MTPTQATLWTLIPFVSLIGVAIAISLTRYLR